MVLSFFIPRLQDASKNFGRNLHGRLRRALSGFVFGTTIFLLFALLVTMGRLTETTHSQQDQAQWWRNHTLDVLMSSEQMDTALNKALRGEREYVLTRQSAALATFQQGLRQSAWLLRHVHELTRDNPGQQNRLAELDRRIEVFGQISRHVVGLAEGSNWAGAYAIARTGRDREALDNASMILEQIKSEEHKLLTKRAARNAEITARTARNARIVLGISFMLLLMVAGAFLLMLRARTAAWRAAEAAKISERLYRLMAEHSNDMVVSIGLDGVRRYVSPASFSLLGYTPEQMVGGVPVAAIHVEDRARVVEVCETLLTGAENPICTYRQQHRDGHYVWLEATYRLVRNADATPVEFVASVRDVSAQVAAQDKIRESERQYRLLADNATDVVLRTDEAGEIVYISASCTELSGFAVSELTGRACADFIHPDDYAVVHAAHIAIITGAEFAVTVEYRLKHKQGGWRWLESHMKPWRAPEDAGGVISAIRDIGNRKRLESDLIDARNAAEGAAHAKTAFLANMSHEIRTPMNGVLGFTELLLSGDLSSEQRRHLELIAESGRSMMRLLNDILDVSKIESGKMQVAEEPVDLRHIIRRCSDLMEPAAQAKGVLLLSAIDASVPNRVVSDPLRLRQILLNLIGNALKFTERGSVSIKGLVESDRLRVYIEDTGIGIAPDRLGAIFEKFAQADESTAGRYGGTGLGLAISADLARLLGGAISVQSTVGQGSKFSIDLPLRSAEDVVTCVVLEGSASVVRPGRHKPRVLIVEDHDINQALIDAMAERAGMTASIAADGRQAIAMVEEAACIGEPFELVLMDMQMPVMDGLEATRRLRSAGYDPSTLPIIALSANAYVEDVRACLDAGMQAHLAKPVRMHDLTEMLARFIKAKATAPAAKSIISPALLDSYRLRKLETFGKLDELVEMEGLEPGIIAEATDMLHKLAGTAAMFGEPELGERARRLEDLLGAWSVADGNEQIRAAVNEIRNAA